MNTKEILQLEFDAIKADLIKEYNAKGMKASGNFESQLEVQVSDNKAVLLGEKYAEQLEWGRKSGKQPPVEAIRQWMGHKGIVSKIKNDSSGKTLAFLIARKIGQMGWNRSKYGGVELVSTVITEKRIQDIIDRIGNQLTMILVSGLVNDLSKKQ